MVQVRIDLHQVDSDDLLVGQYFLQAYQRFPILSAMIDLRGSTRGDQRIKVVNIESQIDALLPVYDVLVCRSLLPDIIQGNRFDLPALRLIRFPDTKLDNMVDRLLLAQ